MTIAAERAQLLALRNHLDPHFLFNTLNAIAEWCREDGEVAERATLQLSDMLRTIMAGTRVAAWPLEREVALIDTLFALYRIRDPDRFVLEREMDDPLRVATSEADLEAAFAVRRAVFVVEQLVREDEEYDGHDAQATHVVVELDGEVVGTARLRLVTIDGAVRAKVERVAVLAAHRTAGAGRAVMQRIHEVARERGLTELYLAAQLEAIPFYERLGYAAYGDEFIQERIRHRSMKRRL